MWLDRRHKMNHLRTRIKKRSSKYSFYKSKKDVGSERVDWVFVGFPSAPSNSSAVDLDNAPLTFEPLRPKSRPVDLKPSASAQLAQEDIWTRQAQPAPPLPPRSSKHLNRRPPPPRPASLYASLNHQRPSELRHL